MKLAKKIKRLRVEGNITQEQLAKHFRVSRSTISSWETGRSFPDLMMIIEICDYFDVSLDFLLREDDQVVKKLNFSGKQKKVLVICITALVVLMGNLILSQMSFPSKIISVGEVTVIRDKNYNGNDPERDWNTLLYTEVNSKNIFFHPDKDTFLLSRNGSELKGTIEGSYSLFHIFNHQKIPIKQSILIDETVPDENIRFVLNETKEKIKPSISIIND